MQSFNAAISQECRAPELHCDRAMLDKKVKRKVQTGANERKEVCTPYIRSWIRALGAADGSGRQPAFLRWLFMTSLVLGAHARLPNRRTNFSTNTQAWRASKPRKIHESKNLIHNSTSARAVMRFADDDLLDAARSFPCQRLEPRAFTWRLA